MSDRDSSTIRTLGWLFTGLFAFLVFAILLARAIVY